MALLTQNGLFGGILTPKVSQLLLRDLSLLAASVQTTNVAAM